MGYTSGVAEELYNSFKNGTYLTVEKYPKMSREEVATKFEDEYATYVEDREAFVSEENDYLTSDEYELIAYDDGTYSVEQPARDYLSDLQQGGYEFALTDEGAEKYARGEDLDEDDFESIRLVVAVEHIGMINVWYDLIKETVGGTDFPDKSVSEYNSDLSDYVEEEISGAIEYFNNNN